MKLVKLIAVGLLTCGFAMSTAAQEKGGHKSPEEQAEMMTKRMIEGLELDEARADKVRAINLEFANKMSAVHKDKSLDRDARKIKRDEISDQHNGAIKEILTEEEFAKFEEEKAKHRAQMEKKQMFKGTPDERANRISEKMKENLNLTREQFEKVSEINTKVEHKIEAIRNNDSMTPEKKKEFIQGNRKDQMQSFKSILTKEQMEKLKKEKINRHEDE